MGRVSMLQYPPGATPLDLDEAGGLIPQHIINQSQLNEWEQANILDTERWVTRQHFKCNEIITSEFLKKLHYRMFNKTWRWAGQFRQSNKNIGVDWVSIAVNLKILLDDFIYQVENSVYSIDELAVRFHHRLVVIHPFPNGNGRHARLMTDIFLLSQDASRFSWGSANLVEESLSRKQYIEALRMADKMQYELLMDFVRK